VIIDNIGLAKYRLRSIILIHHFNEHPTIPEKNKNDPKYDKI